MGDGSEHRLGNINLRVTEDERWSFKAWCVENRMSQVEAFREARHVLEAARALAPGLSGQALASIIDGIAEVVVDRDLELTLSRRSWTDPARAWAVRVMETSILTRDGMRVSEPLPSQRDAAFIAATRFTFEEALGAAQRYRSTVDPRESEGPAA